MINLFLPNRVVYFGGPEGSSGEAPEPKQDEQKPNPDAMKDPFGPQAQLEKAKEAERRAKPVSPELGKDLANTTSELVSLKDTLMSGRYEFDSANGKRTYEVRLRSGEQKGDMIAHMDMYDKQTREDLGTRTIELKVGKKGTFEMHVVDTGPTGVSIDRGTAKFDGKTFDGSLSTGVAEGAMKVLTMAKNEITQNLVDHEEQNLQLNTPRPKDRLTRTDEQNAAIRAQAEVNVANRVAKGKLAYN